MCVYVCVCVYVYVCVCCMSALAINTMLSTGDNLGCFGGSRKKKEAMGGAVKENSGGTRSTGPRNEPLRGMELLWQPEIVGPQGTTLSPASPYHLNVTFTSSYWPTSRYPLTHYCFLFLSLSISFFYNYLASIIHFFHFSCLLYFFLLLCFY